MAPSERTRAKTRSSSAAAAAPKARRTTQNKKKKQQKEKKKKKEVQSSSSTITTSSDDFSKNNNNISHDHHHFDSPSNSSSGCSTPKAERYRIPQIMTCPPAPKKQRVISNCSSLQRTPIAFFAPPDLELFFFCALRDISV